MVDDEPTALRVMARTLVEAGYAVHIKSNGQDALALAVTLAKPLDLVVTDMQMDPIRGPRAGRINVRAETRLAVSLCQRIWARRGLQRGIRSFSA